MSLWQRLILTRRYAPFLVLAVAQLVLVLVAPSVGLTAAVNPFGNVAGGQEQGAATPGATDPAAAAGGTGAAAPGTGTAGSGSAGSAGPSGRTVATNSLGIPTTGDTSHCVAGRQFGDLPTAPACVPKWAGGNNGGATYQGVTDKTIEIVYYREKDNQGVKALEQQINVYSDPRDQLAFKAAAEKFINARYEFYGRKVHIDMFFSASCDPSPPSPDCFKNDVRTLNDQFHPFGVIYENNTAIPGFYDETTRLGIVSFGGWHFGDNVYNIPHRPYHYDVYMGGDSQAVITAEYWCKRLAGLKARFAGDPLMQAKTRKIGIITVDTPVNVPPAQHLADLIQKCDPNFDEKKDFLRYASDITTASQQAGTLVHTLSADGVTSVMIFGDPIAPVYLTAACSAQGYFPEHVLVGSGLLDNDQLGRLYDPAQWKHAFGPSDIPTPLPIEKSDAQVVWKAGGGAGLTYSAATLPWSYFNLLANMLQGAGPHLNPGTLESSALSTPAQNEWQNTHDQYHAMTVLRPGKYTALTDQREVYWDANAPSQFDGKAGSYVPLNGGRRYAPGGWPAGEPTLPAGV